MSSNLLKDERFKALFSNPDFQVNKNSEEFALLNPVISQLDKSKAKALKRQLAQEEEKEEKQDNPYENETQGNEEYFKYYLNITFKYHFFVEKSVYI